ncbi:MAG: hypothetical protein ACYS8I_00630 [Planctomycetota bacterium]
MPKTIPDISSTGSEIERTISLQEFSSEIAPFDLDVQTVENFWLRLTEEADQTRKRFNLLARQRDATRNKRDIDFSEEIENAAQRFRELVLKAPLVLSSNPDLLEICEKLEGVPSIIADLRSKPHLAVLGLADPYGGKVTDIRAEFVCTVHALYSHFTGRSDWVTLRSDTEEGYTNPFFDLLRLAYRIAGIDRSDSVIQSDIARAISLNADTDS